MDEFLESFSPGGVKGGGHVKLRASMYHTCEAVKISYVMCAPPFIVVCRAPPG